MSPWLIQIRNLLRATVTLLLTHGLKPSSNWS